MLLSDAGVTQAVLTVTLLAVFASATPLLLAALGETVGEQSGVLNVGLEGVLLAGAYTAFVTTHATSQFWLGLLVGVVAGVASNAILMVLSVWLGVNQIVVGFGMILAGTGLTSLLYEHTFAATKPRLGAPEPWAIPGLSGLPIVGDVLFSGPGAFYLALAAPVVIAVWLQRTHSGLRLRAAGQRPASLDAAGGSVTRTRSVAVLVGGALAGFGGAYLALYSAGTFTPAMTHGLGFLAIVVAMLGRGRAGWVVLISLIYGVFVASGTALQLVGLTIPNDLITMLPFIAVLIALVFFRGSSAVPPALATAYVRGAR